MSADTAALLAEIELEMMSDMYQKMTGVCHKKCVSSKYREPDLTKGESICIDRCVAKWTTIHEQIGHKLVSATAMGEDAKAPGIPSPSVPVPPAPKQ